MKPIKQKLVTINAWYKDDEGKTQKISFSTLGNLKFKDYLAYQYFGLGSYVTNNKQPPNWTYRTYPVDIGTAQEHGARSQRTVIFSNITGLKPKKFRVEPKYVVNDYNALKTTGFFDHVSIWSDSNGYIYYLLEPYSLSTNWFEKFSQAGFDAIEIYRPIAPYQGGCPNSSSRSFLTYRWLGNEKSAIQSKKLQAIEEDLGAIFEFLNSSASTYVNNIPTVENNDD